MGGEENDEVGGVQLRSRTSVFFIINILASFKHRLIRIKEFIIHTPSKCTLKLDSQPLVSKNTFTNPKWGHKNMKVKEQENSIQDFVNQRAKYTTNLKKSQNWTFASQKQKKRKEKKRMKKKKKKKTRFVKH